MSIKELNKIRTFWAKKYPNISVSLWGDENESRYFGKMMASTCSIDLNANSIGELISQGESFLRKNNGYK